MSIACTIQITLKTWRARGVKKNICGIHQKKEIREQFYCLLRLIVDKPKPMHGNRNDDTARSFFRKCRCIEQYYWN